MTAIRSMETLGFVARIPNPKDRRKVNVYLTDRGRALQQVLVPCAEAALRQATTRLDPAALRQLTLCLEVLIASLMGEEELRDSPFDDITFSD